MKKYRRIHEVLVWKWTGDTSTIDEINEVLKPYNEESDDKLDKLEVLLENDNCLSTSWRVEGCGITREVVRLNEYVVFDNNNEFGRIGCYDQNWLDKNYVEI